MHFWLFLLYKNLVFGWAMHFLLETPVGIAIVHGADGVSLVAKYTYSTVDEAVKMVGVLADVKDAAELPEEIREFLRENVKEGMEIRAQSPGLAQIITEECRAHCVFSPGFAQIKRNPFKWFGMNKDVYNCFVLQVVHKLFKSGGGDLYVVELLNTIESLEYNITSRILRVRNWYSLHFPELSTIQDGKEYLKYVLLVGRREDALRQNGIELPEHIKQLLETSMGVDMSTGDIEKIKTDIRNILLEIDFLEKFKDTFCSKVREVCPNTALLAGEIVAAKLLRSQGSLSALSQCPGSTVQILGAERAFNEAIKIGSNTPKYGIIYDSKVISKLPAEMKGAIARSFAAKIALCVRVDLAGESKDCSFGADCRHKLEELVNKLKEKRQMKAIPSKKQKKRTISVEEYDTSRDRIKRCATK